MIERDRPRMLALASMFAEDVAVAMGVPVPELAQEWKDWAEACACFVFATGGIERAAAAGAMFHTASKLPT